MNEERQDVLLMKCIIQIPCYNEEVTLPITLKDLPRSLPGIDELEYLVIDDGSIDRTQEVARELGVHHIVGFRKNRGLANAFALGLSTCLARGADIIVNTDADNQYFGGDIVKLVEPILARQADIVVGDRNTASIAHFSVLKKFLQRHGSDWVRMLSGVNVPDATSGFRAFSREAALELNVISDFSYTVETLIQAGNKRLAVESVPIRTNGVLRPSRLFDSIFMFVKRSASTMLRVYATHQPLKVFASVATVLLLVAGGIFVRYFVLYLKGVAGAHLQSLILGVGLLVFSAFLYTIGILADLINTNRKLLELILLQQKKGSLNEGRA